MKAQFEFRQPPEEPNFTKKYRMDTDPVPCLGMTDEAFFEKEVEHIWKKQWIYAAKEHYLPNPGDFVVKELPFAKTSVIIIRGLDRKIRAFHNICSHRCNKVIWKERGNAKMMKCEYHGWMYDSDGSLRNITDEKMFFNVNKTELGLTPVHLEAWSGFIFINLAQGHAPPLDLREYLGPFYDSLGAYPFEQYTQEYKWRIKVNANWKIVRDAFIEAYHISYVHSGTAGTSFTSPQNPNIRALDVKCSKYGTQFSLAGNTDYVPPATQALAFGMGAAAVQNVGRERSADIPDVMNPTKASNWAGDLNMFFPSFGCPTFPGQYIVNHFLPIDAKSSFYEAHVCVEKPLTASARWAQEVAQVMFISGIREDVKIAEFSQEVIEGGGKEVMYLQDQEIAVRQGHQLVKEVCGPYPGAKKD